MDVIQYSNESSVASKEYINLLQIPKDIIFPLELSIHLKEKLQSALEEIFRLKKQLFHQDYEVNCLYLKAEKSKSDKYFETKESNAGMASNTHMATKLVELSKRIRDMTAEQESMKTRMRQLMAENDQLKDRASSSSKVESRQDNDEAQKKKSEQEMLSTTQQLATTTQKMMDYRRQTQQLRMELRTALKALCQEVGDGATPLAVLNVVTSNTWRGRQQQILTLQQRNAELQSRWNQIAPIGPHGGAGGDCCRDSTYDDCCSETHSSGIHDDNKSVKSSSVQSTSTHGQPRARRIAGLEQQERNKHELLEKSTRQLECTKQELKDTLLSMKAYKARVKTLEDQVKNCRSQIDTLEGKLGGKQVELEEAGNEITRLSQELTIMKERMKTIRDTATSEVKETHDALLAEKAMTSKLEKKLTSYEEKVETLSNEIQELQISLSAFKNVPQDDVEARKRLQFLELQFDEMQQGMAASENECRRLLHLVEESVERVEEERSLHSTTQRHLIKSFAVIEHAEHCINLCLDVGQISDKKVLETIENLKSMRRELKTGDLFHLEVLSTTDVRKLKARINVLSKEVALLQNCIKQSAIERKKDLQNFAAIVERSRQEFLTAVTNSVKAKQLNLKGILNVNNNVPCQAS